MEATELPILALMASTTAANEAPGAIPGAMTGSGRFLAASRRRPVDRTPVWFMRQAGRALAEYRELREKYDILTMTRTPELCTQVTLMPVSTYGVDAAVMYADIMLPLYGMGLPFSIDPGLGPVIHAPVRSAGDVAQLRIVDAESATPELFEAIGMVRRALDGQTAVIGFAGAPFTVAAYMVEGRPSKDHAIVKALMYSEPKVWGQLMSTLVEVTVRYLRAQVAAGAQALQLFDSWMGALSKRDYEERVLPHTREIFARVRDLDVPLIHFGTGANHLLSATATLDCDVISVDWRVGLDEAWQRIGDGKGIQGNLDPAVAMAPYDIVEREARRVLDEAGGRDGHIFNLGHGVLADTPSDTLKRLVGFVHETTARTVAR